DDAVAPSDLFALVISPPVVGDGHFVHAIPALENLRRNLGLDAESVALELERSEHLDPHCLIAGFHVGEDRVVKNVREKRKQPVSQIVREEKHTPPAEKSRAIDDVRAALADQLDEIGKLLGRILHVGILNDHEVAGDLLEAYPQRRSFAAVLLVIQLEPVLL